ncbi:hypothetical protein [Actinoplanes sichuanensis]|uniref:Uncharacterized protein n=1 Tax=Actinoplanes sichuanensis TaxID=512349 RepID=A0ABW4A8P8_9ACTN|nr:hypothetical protein [Actinoplanes sichuanensis]
MVRRSRTPDGCSAGIGLRADPGRRRTTSCTAGQTATVPYKATYVFWDALAT